ncbi:MAG: rffH [Labilithrix sp.]|nr:rffH [Labilithrix sp.]
MKGVILAGGSGTRLHPLTRITNKHLLPIYDRPMVTYAIEALVSAEVRELMVVTGGTHAGEFLRLLGNGHEWGIDRLSYAYQERAGGIAEALGLAERFAGGDPIVVMLADNVVERSIKHAVDNFLEQGSGARILLAREEDPEHLRHLGVPELDGRGELEITDVNNWFIDRGTMEYDVLEGFWGDAGESIEAYYAVNDFVRTNGANKP